jgi:hypothetical protein
MIDSEGTTAPYQYSDNCPFKLLLHHLHRETPGPTMTNADDTPLTIASLPHQQADEICCGTATSGVNRVQSIIIFMNTLYHQ